MYHGVDSQRFHPRWRTPPAVPPLLLSVGRLRAKKGLGTLIDACRLLRERGVTFQCEIIGYGEEHERLFGRILRHGLTGVVRLAGKLTREKVIEAYARAAVYVQPSRIAEDGDRDGIPNVLLEAMAMGLPVVASNVSGIPELVMDGRNGVLVPADDAAALAGAVERLLHETQQCAALGQEARSTVTGAFDNDRNLQLLCGLLRDAGHACAPCPLAHAQNADGQVRHAPVGAE
jgi:glycosyltransferase involved in cell wall biosynthesis